MSDSSEDEDLSRFKEAVDNSFLNVLIKSRLALFSKIKNDNQNSIRYLDESSQCDEVNIPQDLQNCIGAKVSTLINESVEFVDILNGCAERNKLKGGLKLFKDSVEYLSCEGVKDIYTDSHNIRSKKIRKDNRKRKNCEDETSLTNENDKMVLASMSGEYVLSKEATNMWKSRRKEKLLEY